MMSTDLESLFEQAKACPSPDDRAAFLAAACGDDTALRATLEEMLATAPRSDAYFAEVDGKEGAEEGLSATEEDGAISAGATETLSPGTVLLERYRIVARLGAGGMGEVYRADDLKLRQSVALKFLPEGLADIPRLREALYNEVRQARRTAHRNLCRVYDIGEWGRIPFLSMEFIEGEDLGALLRRIGTLPLKKAVALGQQLCAGLRAVHEAGLLHLDLKPGNLMIDEKGDLRITDFGLSRLASDAPSGFLNAGTPAYMAPEHLLRGVVSTRCDLYAAGLVLYEMLTGTKLHRERSLGEIVAWHERASLPDLPGLVPELHELILRCLAVTPEERPETAAALGDGLRDFGERLEARGGVPEGLSPSGGKELAALMFTDLVGSVDVQQRLGTESYMRYVARHDAILQDCLALIPSARILNETGDGFLVRFADPAEAVNTALRLQYRFHGDVCEGERLRVRIALHVGVVTHMEERVRGEKRAVGMPINLTARLMGLAAGGQILMTRAVYEDARNYVRDHPEMADGVSLPPLEWISHGPYEIKGNPEPMEIFETGIAGIAPLTAPVDGGNAPRAGDFVRAAAEAMEMEILPHAEALMDSDVVIAYAPADDRSVVPGKTGWISQFHDNLEVRLEQLSGEPVKIWRDSTRHAGEPSAEVLEFLPRARTMVSVVSPPFVKSAGCLREFERYWRSAESDGSLRVSNKTRILKVVKTPVPPGVAPPEIDRLFAQLVGFEFFDVDPETGRHLEYDDTFGAKAKQRYYERIYDLAYEIRDVLLAVRAGAEGGKVSGSMAGRTVFLAETTSDLQSERDTLRRELLERGHRVVPALPLPFTGPEFEREVRLLLEEADFAVHLVGSRYGMVPEDTAGSVVELQNRIAAEHSVTHGLERLIWMPRDVDPRDGRQSAFLHALVEDPEAHRGGEVVQDSMENFKRLLLGKLTPPPALEAPPTGSVASADAVPTRTVYLIHESQDQAEVELLEDLLFDLGFEVTTPHFEGDEAEVAKVHRHNLLHCDAALVYYGSSSRPWVEMKLMDLMQAPGYGRTRELLAKSVYVAPSDDRQKARFRTHLADVIRPDSTVLDASALEPFTGRLRQGGAV